MHKNIFISQIIPAAATKMLESEGFSVTMNSSRSPLSKSDFIRSARNADGIICLLSDTIDQQVIAALDACRIIANYAVGYNNIDTAAARNKGIVVTNTPEVLTNATADLTLALILALARRLFEADAYTRKGSFKGWQSDLLLGHELNSCVAGIVGAGRIGAAVARRLTAFGTKIVYFSNERNISMEQQTGAVFVSLEELVTISDIVTLHVPLTPGTRNLLNASLLEKMKAASLIINTSRGEVLDEDALIHLLQAGKIAGAGLDVYYNEPDIDNRFFSLPSVILAPHIGSATFTARNKMAELAARNVISVLSGFPPVTPV